MERLELHVQYREGRGKGSARALRRAGLIPAILYGGNEEARPLTVQEEEFVDLLRGARGEHALVNLVAATGGDRQQALIREVQHHPLTDHVVHVDFHRVSATRKIRIEVPVVLVGEPIGVKDQGGVLEPIIREVEVECLPADLPERLEVNVAHLEIGDSVHVRDLVSGGLHILADPEGLVAVVGRPVVHKEAAPTEEAVAAAAAAEAEAAEAAAAEAKPGAAKEKEKAEAKPAPGKEKKEKS